MRLQYKISAFFAVLILLFGLAVIVFNSRMLSDSLEQNLLSREKIGLEILERRIFPYVADKDYPDVTAILFEEKEIKKELVDFIVVRDLAGNIVAHTFLGDIPEEVLNDNVTAGEFRSNEHNIGSRPVIEASDVIAEGSYKAGYIHVGYKKAYIENTVLRITRTLMLAIIAITVSAMFLGFLFSKIIVGPIRKLAAGMEEISRGNLDVRMNVRTNDELEALAGAFNKVAEDLKKSQAEIRRYAKETEQKIRERTKEVEKSKKDLEEKVGELERFNRLTVGRELKMIELKNRIKEMEEEK